MVLVAPGNHLETSNYQQTFWWEKQEDALGYRLQIVSPKFDSISKFIIDTVVSQNKFVYTLDPGKYEWRVRAENGSSSTAFTSRKFTVYPSSLKDQSVQLVSPNADVYTTTADIKYSWLGLFGSTQYRLQVDQNNFADEQNLLINTTTNNLSFLQTLSKEGKYQFRVRAENATENSKWSSVRNFTYDVTGPEKVVLSSPANKQTVAKPVKLLWNKPADADRFEVYVYQSDSVTLFNNAYPQKLTTTEHIFTGGDAGQTLLWRVRAIDKAGNVGAYSDFRGFVIQ
ncbi:hypothetical protein SAMN04488023_16011 [Pedobacter rhizosphaerae]|uniref:Fibronectin type-III domain-containing protein n=2 Tax=Pedobacter rhizosphaerae TaxID=390241 RepID=A0A1H9W7B6_9SPHI|nr:hypothetical protein SAMN04488023_16011 [Pedobacter rhizosphaerae]